MARKAFVTGGTGFIGSHLVEALQHRGYDEVRCLVRSDLKWLAGLDVVPVRATLGDFAQLQEAVRGVDYVYHVAGVTRAQTWDAFQEGNVQATINLLEAVRRAGAAVKNVLVTSTLAVIGPCPRGVATEATPCAPISQYGRSKAQMEAVVTANYADLPVTIVRPPAVYGPREADIYTFFKTVSRGVCPVVGDGTRPDLSLVHVRDLVRGMIDAAEAGYTAGETYFLGSERFYSWNEVKQATTAALGRSAITVPVPEGLVGMAGALVEFGARLLGQYPPLNREKAREIRQTCKMCAVDKAARDFGYRQEVPLEAGIRETIGWYRAHGWL